MQPDAPPDDALLSLGLYDQLVTTGLDAILARTRDQVHVELENLDPAEAPAVIARHLQQLARMVLEVTREEERIGIANRVVQTLFEEVSRAGVRGIGNGREEWIQPSQQRLVGLAARLPLTGLPDLPARPGIPLAESALLVNARNANSVGAEVLSELESADRVDLLCSFLKWSGFRLIEGRLRRHLQDRGRPMRVITTCYTGATERRVLDRLCELGAEVRVSYDTRRTRLHAKAWLFHRNSGFPTAYIGSSNLSSAALVDGLEWNVRVSGVELPRVIEAFSAAFESYWQDPEFEAYDPERDAGRFDRAVKRERSDDEPVFAGLDVVPYPFQSEILDRLHAERFLHDRWQNLVVAATGTGKTVIAALDYRRMRQHLGSARLLFVAHREEILKQSRGVFRAVLRNSGFGELMVAGEKPVDDTSVFASIQSLSRVDLARLPPDSYDVVIVDEFHHAEAPTYERLLAHLRPKLLLGLTATPERTDGKSVLHWFGDRIAAELRLWEALDRNLLCPFQYFGIADDTNLAQVPWRSGRYDPTTLDNLYTGDHARAKLIADAVIQKVSDIRDMRALGFCASVAHANFMAEQFRRFGIPSVAISGDSSRDDRRQALERLGHHPMPDVNVVFAVDLLNEGIDVPEVNTILFLRPTESATVFLQQLGRGLRLAEGKECLTVLDFIGIQSQRFRFDLRFRALTGGSRGSLRSHVEEGFPQLPPGCAIQLDKVSQERVLENLRAVLRGNVNAWLDEIRAQGPGLTLAKFLDHCELELEDVYRSERSWSSLKRAAGLAIPPAGPDEKLLVKGVARLIHLDDFERLRWLESVLASPAAPRIEGLSAENRRRLEMLTITVWGRVTGRPTELQSALDRLWGHPAIREELQELLALLADRLDHEVLDFRQATVPLKIHGHYRLDEVLVALGRSDTAYAQSFRQGVLKLDDLRADAFFITLQKAEKDYSPSTLYRDYAISPQLFHWESQSTTSAASPTGQRYRNHRQMNWQILLFVRSTKQDARNERRPYTFLGRAAYVSHTGDRPMGITWRLETPMSGEDFAEAKAVG